MTAGLIRLRLGSEAELAESRRTSSKTLQSIGDGVITADAADRVVFLNRAAEELTGCRAEEPLERPLAEVFRLTEAKPGHDAMEAPTGGSGVLVPGHGERTLIARDFVAAWEQADVLVSPTSPGVAFEFGSKSDDPIAMYLNDVATVPGSLAGIPALSLPSGLDEQGLPVGLQVMAPLLREDLLFRAAWAFEEATGFDPTPRGPRAVPVPS